MGIIRKTHLSLWLSQIEDVWYTRSVINRLTGDGTVCLRAVNGVKGQKMAAGKAQFEISGLGDHRQMEKLFEELRNAALVEQRGLKPFFV